MDIKIPFLGDGITSAVVLTIAVKPGDLVQKDQTLLELETDKAVASVPSPASGVIKELTVKVGDKVATGKTVGKFDGQAETPKPEVSSVQPQQPTHPVQPVKMSMVPQVEIPSYHIQSQNPLPTSPTIKQFAALFGVDLSRIQARGPQITIKDVQDYLSFLQGTVFSDEKQQKVEKTPVDFSKWGKVTLQPMSNLRQKIAEKMQQSWQEIPHVTQFDEANITEMMALRKTYVPLYEKKNAKLTLTVFAIKAVEKALKKFPVFNSSYDAIKQELILKNYINIGIAVDTENGLIVPVIKNVDQKSMLELSLELAEIAKKARDRKLTIDELQGGTFTISNLGGLGVGPFTPIVNSPEVAIMGLSKGNQRDGKLFMPISMSYDHRVIDGADGARFMLAVIEAFQLFEESLLKKGL